MSDCASAFRSMLDEHEYWVDEAWVSNEPRVGMDAAMLVLMQHQ